MADPRIKTLKIKTGVLKRITKEKTTYIKEVGIEEARYEKLKAGGSDEHVLKKQQEVIQESQMMVPECHRRIVRAYEDLKSILESEQDLAGTEDYKLAAQIVAEAAKEIENETGADVGK
uniref:Tubulin-specific chaperone A n=1 Tax=Cacopsylla melanoneura TaxID=428564 RepID=A0A8D8VDI2_9HEMI